MQRLSHKQMLFLADTALERLTNEASREGNDLRLVVGHANLLDALMLELAEAGQRQEGV